MGKEAEEKIAEVVNKHWWHEIDDARLLELLQELGYRKLPDKPPLLSDEEINRIRMSYEHQAGFFFTDLSSEVNPDIKAIAQAQLDDIWKYIKKYYGEKPVEKSPLV